MASYDYRCRTCDAAFEVRRSVTDTATLVRCPQGHDDTARVWSAVAVTGAAAGDRERAASTAPAGGCCGGGCCSS